MSAPTGRPTGSGVDAREPRELVTLRLGGPAAGGTCVAHTDGATWFVRGGLPGELVSARVTGQRQAGRIVFASVAGVIEPSSHRVDPPCPLAGSCGGCDLQHVSPDYQRRWKAQVLRDQLERIGRFDAIGGQPLEGVLSHVGAQSMLGWRTRFAIDTNDSGQACFHAPRSSELIPVAQCPIVADSLQPAFAHRWPAGVRVHVSESQSGPTVAPLADGADRAKRPGSASAALPSGWRMATTVERTAAGRTWRVAVDGFWQAHADAADTLVPAVRRALASVEVGDAARGDGANLVDLYSGVGLFAGALASDVSPTGVGFAQVTAVEGDPKAVRLARRNLHDMPTVRLVHADVKEWVRSAAGRHTLALATAVVLDPPRAGAGPAVIDALAASGADEICYVACDGASLARDARRLVDSRWRFEALETFDLFGMSGHIEAVARFVRG